MPYKFHKTSDVLSKLMKDYGLGAKIHEYKILKTWHNTVGEKISSHAQPSSLIRRVLTVIVDSPAWMHQLTFYKEDLISKINNAIGKDAVKDIHFRVGKVNVEKDAGYKIQNSRYKIYTSPIESEKIDGYLEPIKDNGVKEVVRKVITKAMVRKKFK